MPLADNPRPAHTATAEAAHAFTKPFYGLERARAALLSAGCTIAQVDNAECWVLRYCAESGRNPMWLDARVARELLVDTGKLPREVCE